MHNLHILVQELDLRQKMREKLCLLVFNTYYAIKIF